MFGIVERSLHHSLFVGGFAEGSYGHYDLSVMCGVARQGNLQLHSLVSLLLRLEQMYVVVHRYLRNKKPTHFGTVQYKSSILSLIMVATVQQLTTDN